MSEERIFTQKEIYEIRQIASELNFPMKLTIDKGFREIGFDYFESTYFNSILKKNDKGYQMNFVSSQGKNSFYENKDWFQFKNMILKWVEALKRENPFYLNKRENIDKLSPRFYKLLQETIMINNLGFDESSGMLMRKNLEIIVKDYLLVVLPEKFAVSINKKTIGRIVHDFYEINEMELIPKKSEKLECIQKELIELKSFFKIISNTFKIGNDFAHYERKLKNFTSNNMLENLNKIVEYVSHHLEEREIKNKRIKLNNDFESDTLI
ncbi:hypothetical protein [Christiangramia sp. OXR-203]|uniref:hypothetical protein n=1 Tax=Christiangramia sp. OXR-203 TaxID=3100176 RepID=UPI002AC8D010|nr:hypothetical protein [Christiangramia sp. OXR-203]WPY97615.1 hypothetical protein T8I65_10560 [Christiangramia sp. OXR-203]